MRFLKADWYLLQRHPDKKEWLSDIKFQASVSERKKEFLKQGMVLSIAVGQNNDSPKDVHVVESANMLGHMAKEN